jgi:hypothetical protein
METVECKQPEITNIQGKGGNRKMKRALFSLMAFVLVLGLALMPATPAGSAPADDDPEVCLCGMGPWAWVYLDFNNLAWMRAGQFHLRFDSVDCVGGELHYGWCVDPEIPISIGQCFPAILDDALRQENHWCEIAYIMTHYSPTDEEEAAAIQLAIWKYVKGDIDSIVASYPDEVEDRARVIFTQTEGRSVNLFGSLLELTLALEGGTTVVDSTASQDFTATITAIPPNLPDCLAGITVDFSTTAGTLSSTTELTDASG